MPLVGFEAANVVPLVARLVHQQLERRPNERRARKPVVRDSAARDHTDGEGQRQDPPLDGVLGPRQQQVAAKCPWLRAHTPTAAPVRASSMATSSCHESTTTSTPIASRAAIRAARSAAGTNTTLPTVGMPAASASCAPGTESSI